MRNNDYKKFYDKTVSICQQIEKITMQTKTPCKIIVMEEEKKSDIRRVTMNGDGLKKPAYVLRFMSVYERIKSRTLI
jgi:hypothetical protein